MSDIRCTLEERQIPIYFGAVAIALVTALLVPGTTALEGAINPALALMLYVTFLQVPLADLGRSFARGRFLTALLLANFVAVPLLVAAMLPLMPADALLRFGILLVLLAPCIDYVVTFAHLGRADAKLLLAATPSLLIAQMLGQPAIGTAQAEHVLQSLHLLGPSLLFAAFTGVLLFASSIFAGWVENWFVLRRLDSAIQYNPRITHMLGAARAARWARFLRGNISGFAANISLGFMLGLTPAFAAFFGLGLDVRHVTLSTGQIGVASATLGMDVLHQPAFWWAVAMVPFNGALNVLVSFYLAFRLALRAHNVGSVDRARIYRALLARWRSAPLGFFLPPRRTV